MATMKKTIQVNWKKVETAHNILFCFVAPDDLKKTFDVSSVAWQIIVARNTGNDELVYAPMFGFGNAEPKQGKRLLGSIQTDVVPQGHKVDLEVSDGVTIWSKPKDIGGKFLSARNATGTKRSISVGTIDEDGIYDPMLNFSAVPPEMDVQVEIHPILRAYVNTAFQKNDLISAQLMMTKPLWEVNLASLRDITELTFTLDEQGTPRIQQS